MIAQIHAFVQLGVIVIVAVLSCWYLFWRRVRRRPKLLSIHVKTPAEKEVCKIPKLQCETDLARLSADEMPGVPANATESVPSEINPPVKGVDSSESESFSLRPGNLPSDNDSGNCTPTFYRGTKKPIVWVDCDGISKSPTSTVSQGHSKHSIPPCDVAGHVTSIFSAERTWTCEPHCDWTTSSESTSSGPSMNSLQTKHESRTAEGEVDSVPSGAMPGRAETEESEDPPVPEFLKFGDGLDQGPQAESSIFVFVAKMDHSYLIEDQVADEGIKVMSQSEKQEIISFTVVLEPIKIIAI
ncbi:hypothetical protein AXG93_163s1190 [Marchantia polymorpha subsp. ruderalis]|uniref:Uncharacterized protein n=1 Tax=Marchantia polymorpha subsp. ruderalis TaxID=1480154 RepID=A0A176VD35_MARPO|nr:hypothetical protein AXG93_163s1190 [Marchantia polymorpha subsp. ruderalis]